MSDLIVIDESYEEISSLYGEIGELLEERLNEYINIIGMICTEGVTSGDVHDNILMYGNKVLSLSEQLQSILAKIKELSGLYTNEIDEADSDFY